MSGQGRLALLRFKPPDPACDVKTYKKYVETVIAHEVTIDEIAELMGYYVCSCDDLVDKIVADKMGTGKANSHRRR